MYQGSDIDRERNPREEANILSKLTFAYATGIFNKSKKHELVEDDLYNVVGNTVASKLGDHAEREWEMEKRKGHPSLTRTILRLFGREYMLYGLLNLCVRTSIMIARPISLGRLVGYFSPNTDLTFNDALFHAFVVVGASVLISTYNHYYHFCLSTIGLRLKISLCSLMYRKCLKLTAASLSEVTNGRIVTMMSKDIHIFDSALMFGHDLWCGLCQMVVMSYIMYRQIGVSSFIGIAFLFLLSPVQVWLGTIAKSLRMKNAARTDVRLRCIQEVLTSIKLIKFYCWENYFAKVTHHFRRLEMLKLRHIYWLKAVILGLGTLSLRLSFFLCIIAYSLLGNQLTAEKAFVVVGCYRSLHYVCAIAIPLSVTQFAEAKSSIKRIKQYLLVDDLPVFGEVDQIVKTVKVCMKDVTVKYLKEEVLHNLSLEVQAPQIVGVTGDVGSGKSTLLKTIMRDLKITHGDIATFGEISYASQEPWLFPATIRENILFGRPFNRERYETVVRVCALAKDLEALPDKDRTVVSDKGLNFSKGQQMRINLARAVYKRCDIYLLDDILSSLDAKVSKYVFEECIQGFLSDRLRILVSHNRRFLTKMDRVLVLEGGSIKAEGTVDELSARNVNVENYANIDTTMSSGAVEVDKMANESEEVDENEKLLVTGEQGGAKVHIYAENKQEGKVTWNTYRTYFQYAGGWKFIPLLLLLCFGAQSISVYFDYYITIWIKVEEKVSSTVRNLTEFPENTNLTLLLETQTRERSSTLIIYNVIIVVYIATLIIELISFFGLATRASVLLHNSVFGRLMTATMYFFDTYRSGNILNRLSKDMGIVDENLPYAYFETIRSLFSLISILTAIVSTSFIFVLPSLVLIAVLFYARRVYLKTSRSLKRLEGMTRAPVIGYLNTTLEGLTTIRAAGNQEVLIRQFDHHQDLNSSSTYMYLSAFRAFVYWLDIFCNLFSIFIIGTFLLLHGKMEIFAANVGLALTQSFGLTHLLQWGIRQWSEVENTTTSVERVAEYMEAEQEPSHGSKPQNWPDKGRIEYKDVSLKYTNTDRYSLRNVTFTVEPRQKIGVIGRTGAGKSSIISALFRLYDIEGTIEIDGLDIRKLSLAALRTKISIIPQDPVMFEGSIRSNLDPTSRYADEEIWKVLDMVRLKDVVDKHGAGLEGAVESCGVNFSIGQRQLFCLARAILCNNKILVLDEATANIDPNTDAFIQAMVKKLFVDCTVLTIAHRINTVIKSDKIMVVDNGHVVELDDPQVLLAKKTGIFYGLAKQSGLV